MLKNFFGYMCLVDLEKAFDGAPNKVLEWPMRNKERPEVLISSAMSLC